MCELFAIGEQGERAADCKNLSEKPVRVFRQSEKPGRARFLCEIDYSSCFNRREYPFPYCTHRDTRLRVAEEMSDWAMT